MSAASHKRFVAVRIHRHHLLLSTGETVKALKSIPFGFRSKMVQNFKPLALDAHKVRVGEGYPSQWLSSGFLRNW